MHPAFFAREVTDVARDMVGARLLVAGMGGTIVETETHAQRGPASHSYLGPMARNASMFDRAGHAYIYHSCVIHWCPNLVCGAPQSGSAALIRVIEPTD